MRKNDNCYKVIELLTKLEPENQKRIAVILQENMDKLGVNFPDAVEEALRQLVSKSENPNQNLLEVYKNVYDQNVLNFEAKRKEALRKQRGEQTKEASEEILAKELEGLEDLTKSCDDLIAKIEAGQEARNENNRRVS